MVKLFSRYLSSVNGHAATYLLSFSHMGLASACTQITSRGTAMKTGKHLLDKIVFWSYFVRLTWLTTLHSVVAEEIFYSIPTRRLPLKESGVSKSCIIKCGNITIHVDKQRYRTVEYCLQCYFQSRHLTGLVKINGGLMAWEEFSTQ